MRSLEYGLHCTRKHLAGITAWIVEVEDKLATLYNKVKDEKIKKKIIEDIKVIAEYRWTLKALLEEFHKRASEVESLEEAYDICLTLQGVIRSIRKYFDKKVLEWVKMGVEPSVYDEVREIISNILAAEHHIADTYESVLKEELEKEEKDIKAKQ